MLIIYLLAPLAILLAVVFLAGFIWAARRGQMDDLDTPPLRMLLEKSPELMPKLSPTPLEEEKKNVSP